MVFGEKLGILPKGVRHSGSIRKNVKGLVWPQAKKRLLEGTEIAATQFLLCRN